MWQCRHWPCHHKGKQALLETFNAANNITCNNVRCDAVKFVVGERGWDSTEIGYNADERNGWSCGITISVVAEFDK